MTSQPLRVPYESEGRVHLDRPREASGEPGPAALLVHGYGQDPLELVRWIRPLLPDALLIAPEGPSAFRRRQRLAPEHPGSAHNWIALAERASEDRRNDAFLDAALAAACGEAQVDSRRILVLGFSQGAGVALHWWMGRPDAAVGLVGLAGGLSDGYRERLAALEGRALLWVTGSEDPAYPSDYTERLVEAFRVARVDLEDVRLDVGHHLLEAAETSVAAWLGRRGLRG